jgi:hypothetical protein
MQSKEDDSGRQDCSGSGSWCVTPENTPQLLLKRTLDSPACLSGARAFAEVRRIFLYLLYGLYNG